MNGSYYQTPVFINDIERDEITNERIDEDPDRILKKKRVKRKKEGMLKENMNIERENESWKENRNEFIMNNRGKKERKEIEEW